MLDRLIQQAIAQALTPVFDPQFSERSYGFRPGRSAHQAVRMARGYVVAGQNWWSMLIWSGSSTGSSTTH